MTNTKHTPYRIDSMPLPASGYIVIKDSNCSEVCRIHKQGRAKYYQMPKEMRAKAEFIVESCNKHKQLIKTLSKALDILSQLDSSIDKGLAKLLRQTLAKTKE